MLRVSCVVFILSAFFLEVYSYPASGLKQCYQHICPSNTYACERTAQVSDDKKYILSEVNCLGKGDVVLRTFKEQQDNIFPSLLCRTHEWALIPEDSDEDFPKSGGTLGGTEGGDTEIVDTNLIDSDKHFRANSTASEIDDLNSSRSEIAKLWIASHR